VLVASFNHQSQGRYPDWRKATLDLLVWQAFAPTTTDPPGFRPVVSPGFPLGRYLALAVQAFAPAWAKLATGISLRVRTLRGHHSPREPSRAQPSVLYTTGISLRGYLADLDVRGLATGLLAVRRQNLSRALSDLSFFISACLRSSPWRSLEH